MEDDNEEVESTEQIYELILCYNEDVRYARARARARATVIEVINKCITVIEVINKCATVIEAGRRFLLLFFINVSTFKFHLEHLLNVILH